jgi:hypothetical protein
MLEIKLTFTKIKSALTKITTTAMATFLACSPALSAQKLADRQQPQKYVNHSKVMIASNAGDADYWRGQVKDFGIAAACELATAQASDWVSFLACESLSVMTANQAETNFWEKQGAQIGVNAACEIVFGLAGAGILAFPACYAVSKIGDIWNESEKARVRVADRQLPNSSGQQKYTSDWWAVVNLGQRACSSYLQTTAINVAAEQTYISIADFNNQGSGYFNCSWGAGTSIDVPKDLACSLNNSDSYVRYYPPNSNEFYPNAGCYRDERSLVAY